MTPQAQSPTDSSDYFRPDEEGLDGEGLRALQRRKLGNMLAAILPTNVFYQKKLGGIDFNPSTDPLDRLPFTTRAELEQDQLAAPPFGTNLTYPLRQYVRFHQTSGTGGRPMRWLDTAESWAWFKKCWGIIFTAANLGAGDRAFFPFSFGPFVGFWAAFESAVAMGMLAIPAGGLSTAARLKMIIENGVRVVCCTPTYALRMAEVARSEGIDLFNSSVLAVIAAGEPGGSIPGTREAITLGWGSTLFDHTGMTEIGAMSFQCSKLQTGVHVIESEFIPEVIDPKTLQAVPDGEIGELVLTNLGRWGSPLIRYRTGDQVRLMRGRCDCGRCFARLGGGILGRTDDMFIVRGNNVFPTAVESVVRRFPEVVEFRVIIGAQGPLTEVAVEIEPWAELTGKSDAVADLTERVARSVHEALHFRAAVRAVPPGTLPRFEMKAKRFIRL